MEDVRMVEEGQHAVYFKGGERRMKWTTSARMELDVEGVEKVLGVAVARMNGLGVSVGDTSLRIEVDDAGVKRLRIEAAGASRSFEVGDAGFKKPKGSIVNLEIPLKSGDAIGFRLALGDDGRSVKVTPEVAWGEGNYDVITWLEYRPEAEINDPAGKVSSIKLENILFARYKDSEGEHLTTISINEQLPEKVSSEPGHFIAMYYEKIRFENIGGKIIYMERYIEDVKIDYVGELEEREVLIEVKHGYESGSFKDLKAQADTYLDIAKKRNAILMYRFYDEPQSPGAKALFEYLKELQKSNEAVLRIFVGGIER